MTVDLCYYSLGSWDDGEVRVYLRDNSLGAEGHQIARFNPRDYPEAPQVEWTSLSSVNVMGHVLRLPSRK